MTEQLISEALYRTLYDKTLSTFPETDRLSNSKRVQILTAQYIPHFDNDVLEIVASTKTSTSKYNTKVMFDKVQFMDTNYDDKALKLQTYDGVFYIRPIYMSRVNVKVSCSCLDFHYRFAVWDHKAKALVGNPPPPYVKKTDRPPVNPNKTPGVCKHLMALFDKLKKEHICQGN